MSNNITPIFGRLKNVTKENPYVAGAIDIKDDSKSKNQQTINQETDEHLDLHDTEIADRYTKEEVNNIVSRTPETDVIVIEVPAASQSDIAGWLDANTPSGTDPETGRSVRANKLYRVPGPDNTTFSEWAWDGTKYIMLANKDYGIDDEPSPTSVNMVKAKGIYSASKYTKEIVITESTAKSGWNPISKPISGLVYITANSPIMLTTTEDKGANVFIFKDGGNVDGIFIYLNTDYTYYNNTEAINNFKATFKRVDIEDVFGGNVSPNVCQNWVKGYYLNDTFHPGSDDSYTGNDWQFGTINVEIGKYYLVPFCDSNGVQGIVNLDDDGEFVSVNKQGVGREGKVFNTFAIIKAETPKIGITYFFDCWNLGSNVTPTGLLRIPYLCLSDCLIENPYNFGLSILNKFDSEFGTNPYKNVELLMNFEMTPILSGTPGYFNQLTQSLTTDVVGNLKYSVIDVEAGEWYLINATTNVRLRIADFDGSHYSENTSAFQSYFDTKYGTDGEFKTSWILVKPKYNKLCISFMDPESKEDKISYQYPKYCKLERTNNNGLIFLFLQAMTNNIQELSIDFDVIKEWHNGYYDIYRNRLETEVFGDWRYSIVPVIAGETYLVETSLFNGIRIFDVDEDDNMSQNMSVPDTLYISSDNGLQTIFVKPKYNKLGLCFHDPFVKDNPSVFYYPRLARISNDLNIYNKLIKATEKPELSIPLTTIKEYHGGYYDKNYNRIETEVYNGWRYSIIDVEPGETYYIETSLFKNIRIADVDDNGNVSKNNSIPDNIFSNSDKIAATFVRPKYSKLCLSFLDPATKADITKYYFPRYAKVSNTNNDINIFGSLWKSINNNRKEYIVKKSGIGVGDYSSLTRAIMDNFGRWGITLYVEEGEYDLFAELEEYYGTSDFLPLTPKGRGIELGYDIIIKASPNAKIKADYNGDNNGIKTLFSAFNAYNEPNVGGFSLIGVNIHCTNTRYCVHDEKGTSGIGSYTNLYENCNFYLDNRANAWNATACIGGGLGHSGNIIIRHCIFEGLANYVPDNNKAAVSYHNNRNSGAKSYISCVGNYISGDCGLRFSWYGDSQEITDIILEGNNVGHTTIIRAETTDGHSDIENISVKEWNTIVR